jgi:arginine/ornithine transport system substrate-binding protein
LQTDAGKGFAFLGGEYSNKKYFGDGVGVAVRKDDTAPRDVLSPAILTIRANGTYQAINDKYWSFDRYSE